MSIYNEDDQKRLMDAKRERDKRRYLEKKINQEYSPESWDRKKDNFNDIKEIKITKESQSALNFNIAICIILVMGAGFLFLGIYENFFYNKSKDDLIQATEFLSKKTTESSPQKVNQVSSKKWKRTIWEVNKGRMCSKGKCTYTIEQNWRDCLIETNVCNPKRSRSLIRNNNQLNATKTIYL